MRVKLLSMTPDAKELIFAAGRQCYEKGWVGDFWHEDGTKVQVVDPINNHVFSDKEIEGLVGYLKESGHTSVLEHAKFTFAIDGCSRSLTHQLVRHRIGCSFSHQSQRYVDLKCEFSIDDSVVPPKIAKNDLAYAKYENILMNIQNTYNDLIDLGIEPEDARYVLPNAAKTRIVVTMNCVALLHFFGLRCCSLAQWEIRDLADEMLNICKDKLSVVFNNSGSRCISLGYCPESKKRSCGKYKVREDFLLRG